MLLLLIAADFGLPAAAAAAAAAAALCHNRYAELEVMLSEAGRARALYELAISQPVLDMPEALWKAYIDFEIAQVSTRDLCCSAAALEAFVLFSHTPAKLLLDLCLCCFGLVRACFSETVTKPQHMLACLRRCGRPTSTLR
jgi:hypothetical protein